jgi:predicted ribonuclease YlaK
LMSRQAWGIQPKNIGQAMALHTLLDPHIDLVIMTGPAGSGKTGITASFFSIFVQTYLQTLFLLNKLSIYNRLRSNLSNMSLSVT